jgi:hypothetical protein
MIQSGMIHYHSNSPGWALHNPGAQPKQFVSSDVKFDPPFSSAPTVVLALAGLDADHTTNVRVFLEAFDVEADEFNIRVQSWDDTMIHGVWVTWIAHD